MKKSLFSSSYAWALVFTFAILLPAGLWLNAREEGGVRSERVSSEKQFAFSVLQRLPVDSSVNRIVLLDDLARLVKDVNGRQREFRLDGAAIYEPAASGVFRLTEHHTDNVLHPPPAELRIPSDELLNFGRPAAPTSIYWRPVPHSAAIQFLVVLSVRDTLQKDMLDARSRAVWLSVIGVAAGFFAALCLVLRQIVKRPLRDLERMLQDTNTPVAAISPEDFGEYADLVQALKDYVARTGLDVDAAMNLDPVTGLMSGDAAARVYSDAHRLEQEVYAVFYRVNHAKEHVKTMGRSYRDKIHRKLARAMLRGLPKAVRIYALQDHFLMSILPEPVFHQSYSAMQREFQKEIRDVHEARPKDIPPMPDMTVSAVGISTRSAAFGQLEEVLQRLHDEWDKLVSRDAGGWALMNAEDQWVTGVPEEGPAEDERPPEEPAALKDPLFARKVFIVKLAFMFKFDPVKAAQLYKLGFTRLPALLDDGAIDIVRKIGMDAAVQDLVRQMRLVPRRRLYFSDSDFKQVFITDVRLVRKIPRDTVGRWFSAGFRRIEDLADIEPEDIHRIDPQAVIEDVRAVFEHARSLVKPAKA